jgi:hypothetical protein
MSANTSYWERELEQATARLKKLEGEQDQMNPLVFEELRQRREDDVDWYAGQLKLARDREAK